MRVFRIPLAVTLWITLFPLGAWAECSDIVALVDKPPSLLNDEVKTVQLGLSTALSHKDGKLTDGYWGPYTKGKLEELCERVPRKGDTDDVNGSLDLARDYAKLESLHGDWAGTLLNAAFAKRFADELADGSRAPTLALRIAGTPEMTAKALDGTGASNDCAGADIALMGNMKVKKGLLQLLELYPATTFQDICSNLFPVKGVASDFIEAMSRFGRLEAGLPGALRDLQSIEFARWMAKKDDDTRRRLAGTEPAVLKLVEDFRAERPAASVAEMTCAPPDRTEHTLTHYALSQDEIETMQAFVSLKPIMDDFRASHPPFESANEFWRELEKALGDTLDDCALGLIKGLVTGTEDKAKQFQLKENLAERIDVDPVLQPSAASLETMLKSRTRTRAEFETGLRVILKKAMTARSEAEHEKLAAALAALARQKGPITDTNQDGQASDDGSDPPLAQRFSITDADIEALKSAVGEDVAKTLADQKRDLAGVDDQLKLLAPYIEAKWTVTPALEEAINALPAVQSMTEAIDPPDGLEELAGIAYPSHRLFGVALEELTSKNPALKNAADRITTTAQKTEDARSPRVYGSLQTEDCRCAPGSSEYAEVYGFYPFWHAPMAPSRPEAAAPPADGEDQAPKPPAPEAEKVNFEMMSRVAFYGLELVTDQDSGRVDLRNEDQWQDARRSFVNSAHRFRAKADLAFDLRGWMNWDAVDIKDAVNEISVQMAPMARFKDYSWKEIQKAIPTLFDPMQPDGATLIFHDYLGQGLHTDAKKNMLAIIEGLYQALPNRDDLAINVAFDFPLVEGDRDDPLFDELYERLIENDIVVVEGEAEEQTEVTRETVKIIDKIILFLERPTTDTKKRVRHRMEQGDFRGDKRRAVLRSIIPVVPPDGHRLIRTSPRANAPADEEPGEFSQFDDDVVYFRDNFAGIGFWPTPLVSDGETLDLETIIEARLDRNWPLLMSYQVPFGEEICKFTCPNRAYIWIGTGSLFALILMLTFLSFFSGTADRIAFRLLTVGSVRIGYLLLIILLLLLSVCDPMAHWSWILVSIVILLCALILILNALHRYRNGPKP